MRPRLLLTARLITFSLQNFPISSPRTAQLRAGVMGLASETPSQSLMKTVQKDRASYLQGDFWRNGQMRSFFVGQKRMFRGFDRRLISLKKFKNALDLRHAGVLPGAGDSASLFSSRAWSKTRAKTAW